MATTTTTTTNTWQSDLPRIEEEPEEEDHEWYAGDGGIWKLYCSGRRVKVPEDNVPHWVHRAFDFGYRQIHWNQYRQHVARQDEPPPPPAEVRPVQVNGMRSCLPTPANPPQCLEPAAPPASQY